MLYNSEDINKSKVLNYSSKSKELAENFIKLDEEVMSSTGLSLAKNITALQDPTVYNICKRAFIENCYDPEDFDNDPDKIRNFTESMEIKFDNNIRAMFDTLVESAGTNGSIGVTNLNAIIGLSLPLSKDILMNNMFANTLPTMVAESKIINKQFEVRRLIDSVTGKVVDLYSQQNEIFDLLYKSNPLKVLTINAGQTIDAVQSLSLGQNENINNVKVSHVTVNIDLKEGDILPDGTVVESDETRDVKIPLGGIQLNQTYNDPTLTKDIEFNGRNLGKFVVTRRANEITLLAQNDKIKNVDVILVKDNSVLSTTPPRVEWEIKNQQISIDNEVHVATSYSPETAYDHKTLHNVDLLATIVESTRTVLEDYKDAYIIESLNADFERMHPSQKVKTEFDFAARNGYHGSIQQWIDESFKFTLDDTIDGLFRIINDPNAEVLIYGKPSLITKIMPKNDNGRISNFRNGKESQNIEFAKTTYSTANRRVSYISSQKLQSKRDGSSNNEFILLLNPTNERTMYKLVEYQTYLGSEIKPAASAHLPTITAFDRFEFIKFEGVQGRIGILNPSGIRSDETDAEITEINNRVGSVERELRTLTPNL